jgi:hypothetical protein
LREAINVQGTVDPKFMNKVIANRYFVPLSTNK